MLNTTSVYCNSSASVMYISIPPLWEGKKKGSPPGMMGEANRLPFAIAPYTGSITHNTPDCPQEGDLMSEKSAVIYARYSSHNQREESIEGQIRECKRYAQINDVTIIAEYADGPYRARPTTGRSFKG